MSAVTLSNIELQQLQRRAHGIATQWGYGDYREDFAQEVLLHAFAGRPLRLEWLLINFLRREFGDSRTGSGRLRQLAEKFGVRLDAPISEESNETRTHDIIGTTPEEPEIESRLERFENGLRVREIAVLRMIAEGYTQTEIGKLYGVTGARICQLYGNLRHNAKAMIEYWDMKERFEGKDVEPFEVDWLVL